MRILPWGFSEKTSLKIFLRSNFLPVWELKRTGGGWGKGKNFSPFCHFFPSAGKPCAITKLCSLLLSCTYFLDSKAARNSKSEEKHSLSLFTVFHVPKGASHSQKATFSVNHVFTFKIYFAKVVTSLWKKIFFYKSIFLLKNIQPIIAVRKRSSFQFFNFITFFFFFFWSLSYVDF